VTKEDFTQLLGKLDGYAESMSPNAPVMAEHLNKVDKATRSLESIAAKMERRLAATRRAKGQAG